MRVRTSVALTLALTATAGLAHGQSTSPPQPSPTGGVPSDVARAVATLEARLDNALRHRDRAALEPLVAEPFTWVHASDGRVDSRDTRRDVIDELRELGIGETPAYALETSGDLSAKRVEALRQFAFSVELLTLIDIRRESRGEAGRLMRRAGRSAQSRSTGLHDLRRRP